MTDDWWSKDTQKVHKPWGSEEILIHTKHYATKILTIKPGAQLSRQFHVRKVETLIVQSGTLEADIGFGKTMHTQVIGPGKKIHIEPGVIHRFRSGNGTVKLLETSTAELDDVIRLEDDFDRA
jgi:mannose-6-phosphate isomerase